MASIDSSSASIQLRSIVGPLATTVDSFSTFVPPRSIIGPLTTTFIPPSHCSELGIVRFPNDYNEMSAYLAQVGTVVSQDNYATWDSLCWPSGSRILNPTTTSLWSVSWGFYSPGLICPFGYTTACTSAPVTSNWRSVVSGGGFEFQNPLDPGETAAGCCPRYALLEHLASSPTRLIRGR